MNWLARIDVDAQTARIEKIFDSYAWHKRLWECFPGEPDAGRDFLTRIDQMEGSFRLWILADRKPACPAWCDPAGFALKQISPDFMAHSHYAFDLRVNAVKTLPKRDSDGAALLRPDGRRTSGKRVPLTDPQELRAWLERKALSGGFRLKDEWPLEISPMQVVHFRKQAHAAYHGGVQFRGCLEVTNRELFSQTYQTGIGSAKSFGFGLLLLAPINY